MDAAATGATASEPWSARLGPAATCAAAMAVPLAYLPNLDAIFTAPKLALLLVAGALGIGSEAWLVARGAERVRWPTGLAVALGAVLATTILSAGAAWVRGGPGAPYAAAELARLIAVSGIALGAAQAASSPSWRRLLFRSIHAAAGVVSAIGLLQHLQILPFAIPIISVPGATFGNRNIAAEAVATSIPFGLGLLGLDGRGGRDATGAAPWRARTAPPVLVLALLVLEVVYLAVTRTRGAWLGGVIGAAVFFSLGRSGGGTPRVVVLVVLGLVAAAAIVAAVVPGRLTARDAFDVKRYEPGQRVVLDAIDPTAPVARTRFGLWRRTWALARQHPIVGVGPGNFAVLFPSVAEPGARADGVLTSAVVPRRAHNDLLERVCETGGVGLAALLALYVAAARVASRRVRGARDERRREGVSSETDVHHDIAAVAAGAASLTAVISCGMTGFPLAMPATALLFGVSIGVLAAQPTASPSTGSTVPTPSTGLPRPGRRWPASAAMTMARAMAAAIALAALVAALVMSKRTLAGSFWLARAEASLRDPRPEVGRRRALEALARAAHASPGQFRVALLASRVATRAGLGEAAVRWASEALAIEPFSPHAWTARADAELVVGDAGAAAAAATRALALLQDYPEVLATWARAAARLGDRDAEREARARLTALAAADGPGASPPADKAAADLVGASSLAKEARSALDALGPASLPSPGAADARQ